ncbi:response regulator [Candidatus Bathyarchaeota archaeon]|nr:response regulator [Candidatus Bathyarchaeota archaeon]
MGDHARILIVDDEESIRKVLATILEEEGYFVDTAKNGKEAIEKSEANFYNLALLDIRLPDMEGTELLTAMRETTPKMIKVIMTGYPSLHNAVKAVNKGADAYILKPFDIDDALRTIKEQLERQQGARKYSEDRVAEFIVTRAKELEAVRRKPVK